MGEKSSIKFRSSYKLCLLEDLIPNLIWDPGINMNDDFYDHKQEFLKKILKDFHSLNLFPKIGVELEFYLCNHSLPADTNTVQKFISDLKENINTVEIEPEQGAGQIEIKTNPYSDIEKLCADILEIKNIIKTLAQKNNLEATFASLPFKNDCASALQINFSLVDDKNNFLFAKNNDEESKILLWSIAGILSFTKNIMLAAAPKEEDYQRFDLQINRNLYKNKKYTSPVNLSWGYNNRTALVRIPATQKNEQRRLEFRLPSSDADIYLTIFSSLAIIKLGIEERQLPPQEIYGNAFDEQYNLEPLTNSLQAAKKDFFNHSLLQKIIQK